MAKHFRQDEKRPATRRGARQEAREVAATRKAAPVGKHGDTTGQTALPYGAAASYRYTYPSAARRDEVYFEDDEDFARGGIHRVGRGFFLLLAWMARVVALALFVLVILNGLPIPPIAHHVAMATQFVTEYLPWHEMRTLAVDTPFGGSFRCDLCLLSLGLFVLDWLFCRLRAALV